MPKIMHSPIIDMSLCEKIIIPEMDPVPANKTQ